ncbi:hypothetical protein C0992_006695 [Termitomyces sp. T32_za158]|nr:hypothetical protein C0992_006695 [Termitomyces sp. T32_za158]
MPTDMDDSALEARQHWGRCVNRQRATPFYRLYNPQIIDHFYTTSNNEANRAAARGYTREGISSEIFRTQQRGTVPFYRLYSASATDHFYTTSASEANSAVQNLGYMSQGIAGYIYPNGNCRDTVPLYRLYSASGTDHFYTTSAAERASAMRIGYSDEGIAGYVFQA